MAGGPHAQLVPCSTCMWEAHEITKATRISEGVETDWYVCEKGHRFGIDFEHGGPPAQPMWPPGPDIIEAMKFLDESS